MLVLSEIWIYGPLLTGGTEIRQLWRVYGTAAVTAPIVDTTGGKFATPLNLKGSSSVHQGNFIRWWTA